MGYVAAVRRYGNDHAPDVSVGGLVYFRAHIFQLIQGFGGTVRIQTAVLQHGLVVIQDKGTERPVYRKQLVVQDAALYIARVSPLDVVLLNDLVQRHNKMHVLQLRQPELIGLKNINR